MNPEEIIASEEARLGRRLTPDEKRAVRGGAASVGGESSSGPIMEDTRAGRTAMEALLARHAADESNAVDRSGGAIGELASSIDRSSGGHAEDMLTGVADAASMGFMDELHGSAANLRGAAAATARLNGIPEEAMDPEMRAALSEYDAARDARRLETAEASERNPMLYGAGALSGGFATAPLTPGLRAGSALAGGVTRGASAALPRLVTAARGMAPRLGAAAATGAGYAALGGVGSSEEEDVPGILADAAREAPGGAAMGAGLGLVGEGLGAARSMAPAMRDWADRAILSVPGGSGASGDRLARSIGGGRSAAARAVRESGLVGPISTPSGVSAAASREIADAAPTSLERLLAAHPEGGVNPTDIAREVEGVVGGYPNPSERAAMGGLTDIARDMRTRGRPPEVPGLTVTGDRPSPAPDELFNMDEPPRLSTVSETPSAEPRHERGAGTAPPARGPGRRRLAMADTMVSDAPEPDFRDTLASDLLMPELDAEGRHVRVRNPLLDVPGSTGAPPAVRPSSIDIPDPSPPVTRPRGARPLGARPMVAEWDSPPPAPPTIPYSGTSSRTPDSAMHVLDRLGEEASYGAARTDTAREAARSARSRVRDLLDRHAERLVGPDELADHRRRRDRAHVAMSIRDSADPAASRDVARGIRPVGMLRGLGGAAAGYSVGGLPGAAAGGAAALAPEILTGAIGDRVPAATAALSHGLASALESPALTESVGRVHRLVPDLSGAAGRVAGASEATDYREPFDPSRYTPRLPVPDVVSGAAVDVPAESPPPAERRPFDPSRYRPRRRTP